MTDNLALKRVAEAAEELAKRMREFYAPGSRRHTVFETPLAALESALAAAQARREA